ncbi:hypothetical protein AQUCO_00700390v1 [Aquilegia coerulea]|uniref:Uncharacterized protein n=1 Tax=Aquilegia coerulea TaxID=218851 RepID=A0A2G5EJT7_AQUCA|nr:hypothetical protein AQUCO_00700390v1 [Aquilegia coerulea]
MLAKVQPNTTKAFEEIINLSDILRNNNLSSRKIVDIISQSIKQSPESYNSSDLLEDSLPINWTTFNQLL